MTMLVAGGGDRVGNGEPAEVEVDVAPAEAEHFSAPHARGREQPEADRVAHVVDRCEERRRGRHWTRCSCRVVRARAAELPRLRFEARARVALRRRAPCAGPRVCCAPSSERAVAVTSAGLELLGVEPLDLQRGQRLQLVPAEVSDDPIDRHRVAVMRRRSKLRLRRRQPFGEVVLHADRRSGDDRPRALALARSFSAMLGRLLRREALPEHLAALARLGMEAGVDAERPAAAPAEHRPRGHGNATSATSVHTFVHIGPFTGRRR